jgi:hypothetical protein
MKRLFHLLTFFAAILTLTACAIRPVTPGNSSASLLSVNENINGNWEGILHLKRTPAEDFGLRLSLETTGVKVFHRNSISGIWAEAMPGLFHISRQGSNAVIQATDSGNDEDGTWVETWALIVTSKSRDELQVEWVRLVNNINLPISRPGKVFSEHSTGNFRRSNGG